MVATDLLLLYFHNSLLLRYNKNTQKPGLRFKFSRQVFISPAFLCCSLIENRQHSQLDKMSWSHWMCCRLLWWDMGCSILLLASQKMDTFVRTVNAKKNDSESNHHNVAMRHVLLITVCKCLCACTKVWVCKRAGKILHGNAIGWPNYAQNSLTNARDMGFHITGPACTNSPQPTIFRLSQWNLSNHTAGGWKDSWVATFFYSKLFMQGLGLVNLRKYIFLHRKSGTLCHVYSGKPE